MVDEKYLRSVYKGKKIFITGHTGFKGSWLLLLLDFLGAEIWGYSLAPLKQQDLYNKIAGDSLCKSFISDIRDKEKLRSAIDEVSPDFIFHLAAQPLVRTSYKCPTETFETNVLGTAYLLEAVRTMNKACTIVVITTDKVYENREWHYPYREVDPLGGYDPYSSSKAATELVVNSYRSSFFPIEFFYKHQVSIATARAGNVIGGGDWSDDRIIPDLIRSFQNDEMIELRNPKSIRPWQHVLEPLFGYLLLGSKLYSNPLKYSSAWNFGPYNDENLTVKELVEIGIKIWGRGNFTESFSENNPHEANLLKLDISKTINELEWMPKWSSKEAIHKTIEWYKLADSNERDICLSQIRSYL